MRSVQLQQASISTVTFVLRPASHRIAHGSVWACPINLDRLLTFSFLSRLLSSVILCNSSWFQSLSFLTMVSSPSTACRRSLSDRSLSAEME